MKYSKDIAHLSKAEAFTMLANLKKEHMNIRFQKKLEGVNAKVLRAVKKDIARLLTRINKKES